MLVTNNVGVTGGSVSDGSGVAVGLAASRFAPASALGVLEAFCGHASAASASASAGGASVSVGGLFRPERAGLHRVPGCSAASV